MTPHQLSELAESMACDTDDDMASQIREHKLTPEEYGKLRRDYIIALQNLWGME